jgi:KDZ transposase-like protein
LNVLPVPILTAICLLIGIREVQKSISNDVMFNVFTDLVHVYRYIYTQFLAVDGNFKLRLKERGIADPELAPGWAYFVEEEKYQEFIKDFVDEPEV